jgi:hypothetical protein
MLKAQIADLEPRPPQRAEQLMTVEAQGLQPLRMVRTHPQHPGLQ